VWLFVVIYNVLLCFSVSYASLLLGDRNSDVLAGFTPFALKSCDYVPSPEDYINLNQKGIRRREITGVDEYLYIQQLFGSPSIMSKYSILIYGPPSTTGFGKSCLARSLASAYLKWRVESGECMPEDTFVHITSTVDYLQGKTITNNHAIIFDEFKPSDAQQNPKLSEDGLKVMLDVRGVGTVHCRYGDTMFPPCARFYTSNAATAQHWCGDRFIFSEPMQRKCFAFLVSRPLLKQSEDAQSVASASHTALGFNCNLT
jgi:hypothetical protein